MKKNIKKILKHSAVVSLVAINIFANVLPVVAISIPSASSVAADLERRYHINQQSVQNEGEMFNVSANKQAYPQTLFTFSPADPVEGEKLTVVSTPTYFLGATDTLYFTWYLKRSGCGIENNVSGDKKLKCDEDGDGDVTTNDWKVAAMKEIVRGGWEPNYRDYKDEGVTDGNIDSYYNHVCDSGYVSDKDGYEAAWGGDLIGGGRKDISNDGDVNGDEAYCYLYDAPSGQTYEIRSGSSSSNQSGATFQTISGEACPNPVCLEMGTESCMENTLESVGPPPVYTQRLVDYSVCKDASATPTCEANAAGDYEAKCSSGSLYCGSAPSYNCNSIANNTCSSVATQGSSTCSMNNSAGANIIPDNFCKHLFPKPSSGRTGDGIFDCDGDRDKEEKFWVSNPEDPDTSDNGKKDEMNAAGLGQSEFSWTYAAGDKVGVLIEGNSTTATKHDNSSMKLMWATPVKPCDLSSYTGNMDIYTKKIKGYDVKIPYIKLNNDWDAFWKKCMEDNLVDPRQGGQATKLNVTISKIPENPVNDPDGKRGDMVTVQSAIDNLLAQGTSTVEYEWSISAGNSISTNSWKKICDSTDGCTKNGTVYLEKEDHTNLKGNDISSLSFKLNIKDTAGSPFNEDIFYLKVHLEARENFSADEPATRVGRGDVIIKVLSSNERIGAFIPEIASDYKIETTGIPICEDNPDNVDSEEIQENFCFVTKNQIVGVKLEGEYDNFAWKLDGSPLQCDRSVSPACEDTKATGYAFFPVTKDVGGVHSVLLTATNTKTGKNVNLVRNFAVVKPYVKIMPDYANGSVIMRKYLGQYLPLDSSDNACTDDDETKENTCYEYSDKDYETPIVPDKTTLMEEFHPYWIGEAIGDEDAQWTINGLKESPARAVNFELPADAKVGDVFVISFDARYKPDNNMRIAMNKIWGIDQFQTTEENLTHTVAVKIVEGTDGIVMNSGYRKFFATIFTNTPGNIAFLVRIMLTAFVLIFLGGLAYTPASRKIF